MLYHKKYRNAVGRWTTFITTNMNHYSLKELLIILTFFLLFTLLFIEFSIENTYLRQALLQNQSNSLRIKTLQLNYSVFD